MKALTTLALAFAFYVVSADQTTIVAGPFVDLDVCERIARIMSDADPAGVFAGCVWR